MSPRQGGLNIPSNVNLNNYVITVESGDLNFNGSGQNLNNNTLVTKAGNINFANAQAKDVKAFASGSINMNGGATFAGSSLLANNSSSGNINFSGATSTIKGSDELKVFSAGSITFNGASETRGKFVSAGNFTFNGNSTLYGEISAKGDINFNGNATVVGVNSNSAPSDLSLNPSSIAENVANNSVIGTFTTTDANSSDTHTYSLVSGAGDSNNNAFNLLGNQLRINNSPDFELLPSYTIRVRTTDNAGASFDKAFTVDVSNVNEAPTAIALNNLEINENVPDDSVVGIFNIADPDLNATHNISLISGAGDEDNAAFSIVGNQLKINRTPDFESKASYNLRVKATDVGGLSQEKNLTIAVNDLNEVPTALNLSNNNFNENLPVSSEIATLSTVDPDAVDTHTISLVAGEGDTDNNSFKINGDRLYFKNSADFESKDNYNLRVRTTDKAGNSLEKILYLNVNNVNEAPISLNLSANSFNENIVAKSAIANLSSTDPDANNTHSYSLVAGSGDTDNNAFTVVNNQLQINNSPDFETQNNYTLRIRTTDADGLSYEKAISLAVNNLNEAPIKLNLSNTSIDENSSVDTVIATLSNSDPDAGDTHTYSLVAGSGDVDNNHFNLVGNELRLNNSADFESQSSYSLRIRATDAAGLFLDEVVTISVKDLKDLAEIALNLNLANDTGTSNSDRISSEATIKGSIDNLQGDINLTGSLNGSESLGISDLVQADGSFTLGIEQLKLINNGDLEDGSYTLQLTATDSGSGKTIERELAFTLDTSATTLNLITPLADGDHSSTARLIGQLDEAATLEYALDGNDSQTVELDSKYKFNSALKEAELAPGTHNTIITVTDTAGNVTENSVSFEVKPTEFSIVNGTHSWGAKDSKIVLLGEQDGLISETSIPVQLGQAKGSRTLRFELAPLFDKTNSSALKEDQLLVYLVDPSNPTQTLLGNGEPGTAVFSLAGEDADFTPGLVTFDGQTVEIDLTSLGDKSEGLLVFQLLNHDGDTGSMIQVGNLSNIVDETGAKKPLFPESTVFASAGEEMDLSTLSPTDTVEVELNNVRFDSDTGKYVGELQVINTGEGINRQLAVVFPDLPNGVELALSRDTCKIVPHLPLTLALTAFQAL